MATLLRHPGYRLTSAPPTGKLSWQTQADASLSHRPPAALQPQDKAKAASTP